MRSLKMPEKKKQVDAKREMALAKVGHLISEIAIEEEKLAEERKKTHDEIERIEKESEKRQLAMRTILDAKVEELYLFSSLHWDVLSKEGKTKIIRTFAGSVHTRMSRPSVIVVDQSKAVKELRGKGLERLVKTVMVEKVDKTGVLREDPELVSTFRFVHLFQQEEFAVKLRGVPGVVARAIKYLKKVTGV